MIYSRFSANADFLPFRVPFSAIGGECLELLGKGCEAGVGRNFSGNNPGVHRWMDREAQCDRCI